MRKLHRLTALLFAVILTLSLGLSARGYHDVVDLDRLGSLTLTFDLPKGLSSYGTVTLYQVGEIYEDNGDFLFRPVPALTGGTLSYDDLAAKDLAADTLEQVKAQKLTGITGTIAYSAGDKQALVTVGDLPLGLYLVVQETPASGYYAISPFLVSVPYVVDKLYQYDVTAKAKTELEQAPTTVPTKPKDDKLPQTGQLNWPVPMLAACGTALIAFGWVLRSSKREQETDEN